MSFGSLGGLLYMDHLVIGGAIDREYVPELCERARRVVEDGDDETVLCDVGSIASPDAVAVDLLARLQLLSKHLGRRLKLVAPPPRLLELIGLMGLSDVLVVEPRGQPEQREEMLGVEEEADPADGPI